MAAYELPIVDISSYGLGVTDASTVDPQVFQTLADTVCDAFKNLGIIYIKNHGIPKEQIESLMTASRHLFELPVAVKENYRTLDGKYHGWISFGIEKLNPERAVDCRESYHYKPCEEEAKNWPKELPEFEKMMKEFHKTCELLILRMFALISWGLGFEDKEFLRKSHSFGKPGNFTSVRCSYYPPPPDGQNLLPNQLQCGEHFDFDTITLLFQDNVGGLQTKNNNGDYVDATPIDDTIVVNIGDCLQRFSADKLKAPIHRVKVPDDKVKQKIARQSIAYFVHPDDDVMISCLDGSGKYEPILNDDYLKKSFGAIY